MSEQWNDDGEAEEERQRSRHQQHCDDQTPGRHRHGIACDRTQRCRDRFAGTGMVQLTATILREMERGQHRYGMVTMCVGMGQGAAGIFERV